MLTGNLEADFGVKPPECNREQQEAGQVDRAEVDESAESQDGRRNRQQEDQAPERELPAPGRTIVVIAFRENARPIPAVASVPFPVHCFAPPCKCSLK